MGRGRAPCCAKVGLNKGSWTPEEDMRLIAYIHKFGHGNWRALPKLAGLLRCGKSCRLRWINYLRPDIKRGNFTKEEEDTIIKLHELLGNKWSKIASCLPGRTDNEIKNVWNTHLKKRLNPTKARKSHKTSSSDDKKPEDSPSSPSSITTASISCSDQEGSDNNNNNNNNNKDEEKKQLDSSSNSFDELELEQEIDKIEIPIEPNMDLWNMLDDTAGMGLNIDSPSIELPDISIEPEMWSMIEEGLEVGATNEMIASTRVDETKEKDESERWLAYLENELGLGGEINASNSSCEHSREVSNFGADGVEGEDPLTSYFHAQAASSLSSSSPLDLLY